MKYQDRIVQLTEELIQCRLKIDDYETVLMKIAAQDYRGNKPYEITLAQKVLNEHATTL